MQNDCWLRYATLFTMRKKIEQEFCNTNHPFLILSRLQDRNMQMNRMHIEQLWEQKPFSGLDYGSELKGCSVSIKVHFYE